MAANVEQQHLDEPQHPGVREYAEIATILTVLTAVEVALFFITGMSHATMAAMLLVLMVAKFILVVGWYMHLKFDNKLYTYMFVGGLLISGSIVISIVAMFGIFGSGDEIIRQMPPPQ